VYSLEAEAEWLRSCQVPPPHPGAGALCMTPARGRCVPYFANLALTAALAVPGMLPATAAYLNWYLAHTRPDGSMDDWFFDARRTWTHGRRDSVDSYAATFLTLAQRYSAMAGPAWAQAHLPALRRIAGAIERLRSGNGLTWARRTWPVQFTMDNSEVHRGLSDWSDLLAALGEPAGTARAQAERTRQAVLALLWDARRQAFYYARLPLGAHAGPNWTRWVEAAVQQSPLLSGVIPPDDLRARVLYLRLCLAFPAWELGETGDPFPWLILGRAAAALGDRARVQRLLAYAEAHFMGGESGYWYCGEAGHYLQLRLWLEGQAHAPLLA